MGLCTTREDYFMDQVDGYYSWKENERKLDNDVGDFLLLSHDVIRELLKRCEALIKERNSSKFIQTWENLVDFQEIHHVLYDGHLPGQIKKFKGLIELLLNDEFEEINSLRKRHCQLACAEKLVTVTFQQEGFGESFNKAFETFREVNLKHLDSSEGYMIPKMLEVRHWRKEFQLNVLPPALKLNFGWFIGFGVQILDEMTDVTFHENPETTESRVPEWISCFYKLATKKQWEEWHCHIHEKLLALHGPAGQKAPIEEDILEFE